MTILQRCICIGVFTGMIACKSKKENPVEVGKFQITSAFQTDTSVNKEYVAEIQSIQNVEIRAKVKGFIESIHIDEGQHVSSGQLLFTIRPIEYEAALLKAKAEVKKCELEVQNVKMLAEKNIVSKTELSLALAKLDQAKSEETLAELYVTYTKIRAPFEGIIDRLKFKQGSLIDEGTLLTSISNNRDVYAYFNVSEVEYLDFKSRNPNNNKMTAGLPAQLLENRPDIRKAELDLMATKFDVQVARAEFFPSLNLGASLGYNAFSPKYLLRTPESIFFSLAGELVGPLINKNAIIAAFNTANAAQIQAAYNYQKTILNGYLEVTNQLGAIQNMQQAYQLKTKEVETLASSIEIASELFKASRANYLEVLVAQRDALETRLEWVEAKKMQWNALTNLFKACGGGWR